MSAAWGEWGWCGCWWCCTAGRGRRAGMAKEALFRYLNLVPIPSRHTLHPPLHPAPHALTRPRRPSSAWASWAAPPARRWPAAARSAAAATPRWTPPCRPTSWPAPPRDPELRGRHQGRRTGRRAAPLPGMQPGMRPGQGPWRRAWRHTRRRGRPRRLAVAPAVLRPAAQAQAQGVQGKGRSQRGQAGPATRVVRGSAAVRQRERRGRGRRPWRRRPAAPCLTPCSCAPSHKT